MLKFEWVRTKIQVEAQVEHLSQSLNIVNQTTFIVCPHSHRALHKLHPGIADLTQRLKHSGCPLE